MKFLNRITLTFFLLLVTTVSLKAQQDLRLYLTVDNYANVGYLKQAYVRAFLKNTSTADVKMVHPGYAEPLWYVDQRTWKISFNNNPVQPFSFAERPYTKFTKKKNNLVLKPGDSVAVAVHPMEFKEEGIYQVTFSYAQLKEKADPSYVEKNLLKENLDFTVHADTLRFTIGIKDINTQAPKLPLEELNRKGVQSSFAEAFTDPEQTYRLTLSDLTPAQLPLLKRLKNLQWLELTDSKLDTLPAFLGDLHLQHLHVTSATQTVHFPEALSKLESIQTLYLAGMKLDTIPGFVYRQKKLLKLEIRVTQLKRLTGAIAQLKDLKEFVVFYSTFEQVPPEITALGSLEQLTLESGALKNIDFLESLPSLKSVKIAGNTSFREHPLAAKLREKGVAVYFF